MNAVKFWIWGFVAVVFFATAWLGWLNRASEKVDTNLPTALAVGLVGALLTFDLQPPRRGKSHLASGRIRGRPEDTPPTLM